MHLIQHKSVPLTLLISTTRSTLKRSITLLIRAEIGCNFTYLRICFGGHRGVRGLELPVDNSSVTYRPDKLMNHTGPEIKGRPYYSSVHYNYTSFNGPEEDCRQARSDKAAIHSLFMGIYSLLPSIDCT